MIRKIILGCPGTIFFQGIFTYEEFFFPLSKNFLPSGNKTCIQNITELKKNSNKRLGMNAGSRRQKSCSKSRIIFIFFKYLPVAESFVKIMIFSAVWDSLSLAV